MNRFFLYLLFSSILFLHPIDILAQNEQFHGGSGDGFSSNTITNLNFSNINYVGNDLTLTVNTTPGQDSPTENSEIHFTVQFSEPVTDFTINNIILNGTAHANTINFSGTGAFYELSISGMQNNGTVQIEIPTGVFHNSVGNPNQAPDNINSIVHYSGMDVGLMIQADTNQNNPTNTDTIHFSLLFDDNVSDFTIDDLIVSGSAQASIQNLSGSGSNYEAAISDMQNDGAVILTVDAGSAHNNFDHSNIVATSTIIYDIIRPSVEITQAPGQTDPAMSFPVQFQVKFSEPVFYFTTLSVNYGGSIGSNIEISGNGDIYIVSVYGLSSGETISISIPENEVFDFAYNPNIASINTDNSITYTGTTSFEEITKEEPIIYYQNGSLFILLNQIGNNHFKIQVFSTVGKLILQKQINKTLNAVPLPANKLYIVKVFSDEQMFLKKIFAR